MRLLLLFLLLPLSAQEFRVLHLDPRDASILARIGQEKLRVDQEWKEAQAYLRKKYTMEPGVAEAGSVKLPAESSKSGWEYGFDVSDDFSVIVARPKPCESQ